MYATQADLVQRFGETEIVQLSDRSNQAVAIDADVVAQALADTDGEIDGYLRGRYTLPLATVPQPLKRIACDVARYRLYDDRATDQVKRRYDEAVKFLTAVSIGRVQLGLDASNAATPVAALPEVSAPARVFDADSLRDF